MASRVPHFSGKSIGRVPREYVSFVLVGVAALLLLLFIFPMQILVAVTIAYLVSIPFAIRSYSAKDRADG
jgi:CDP-diacylglycerol--serine O-phosphatidyltransferase